MWRILVALSCIFSIGAAECFKRSQKVWYYRDCQEALEKGDECSGVYNIKPDELPPFQVYCDMESDGGGWTVFQRRMDGTEDFYRGWADYVKGFGDLNGEFWLGLNKIHRLTNRHDINTTLRVDLEDFDNTKRYAKYTTFHVLDSSTKYQLNVGEYSGDAEDSISYQDGSNFSTKDQDNDGHEAQHCATSYKGGWWYSHCHASNLNGRYLSAQHTSYADGVNWYYWRGHFYSLKIAEMKLR